MNSLVKMISDSVFPYSKPAVYISGGLDSSIVLHHVCEKCDDVYTYTASFGVDGDETRFAMMLANHYHTRHTTVEISGFIERLPEILKDISQPYINCWIYLLAEAAKKDNRNIALIGEGSDERFGGYENKDYTTAWADHYTWAMGVYKEVHNKIGLQLDYPFEKLNWRECLKWYAPPTKEFLRESYRDILPQFVIERRKTPPAYTNYWQMWNTTIYKHFPKYEPKTTEDIKNCLKILSMRAWLKVNSKYVNV